MDRVVIKGPLDRIIIRDTVVNSAASDVTQGDLDNAINEEAATRQSGDTATLAAAAADATAKDTALLSFVFGSIDDEAADRTTADSALDARITDEITNRTSAVTNEATARANADSTEATTRATADVALGGRVDAEAAARISGDAASVATAAADATTKIAAEATARDAAITAAITALVNGAPGALDTLKEIADKLAADDTALAAILTTLATKIDAASPRIGPDPSSLPDGDMQVSVGGLWLARTPAQVRTHLALGTAAQANVGDFDAAGAAAAAQAASQPLDSDLTLIAALSTTPIGRSLLAGADASALRAILALGSAATQATSAFDAAGAAASAQAASQPLDSDLTAIAALSTTPFGRALLATADAAALRIAAGLGTAATQASTAFDAAGAATAAQAASQPLDSDLTTIAALTATTDSVMQAKAGAWTARTLAQLGADMAGTATPQSPGTPAVGAGTKFAREDHVHGQTPLVRMTSGLLYNPPFLSVSASGGVPTAGTLYVMAFSLPAGTIAFVGFGASTPAVSVIRMGIYADAPGKPGALLLDAGTTNGNAVNSQCTANLAIEAGVYWIAFLAETTAAAVRQMTGQSPFVAANTIGIGAATAYCSWSTTGVASGGLPNPHPVGAVQSSQGYRLSVQMA